MPPRMLECVQMLDNVEIGVENSSLPAGQFCLPAFHASLHALHYYSPYHGAQLMIIQNTLNKGFEMLRVNNYYNLYYKHRYLSCIHSLTSYHHCCQPVDFLEQPFVHHTIVGSLDRGEEVG